MYSITTIATSLLAGYLFNIYYYLPMILQVILCLIMFGLSFVFVEANHKDKREADNIESYFKDNVKRIIFLIIVSFVLSTSIIILGQSNSKLFMQYDF